MPFTDASALAEMISFYGLPEDCPLAQQLIARSGTDDGTQPKRLYFVSSGVALLRLKQTCVLTVLRSACQRTAPRRSSL